ncbi:beta strand repeat-containing protein [Mesorhizobium sp. 113-3-3]|uniref:beta strand repeat-containing protein n=1 Tax=Mesorhizobium sp. 113-3-3 TaxID=2744516 RepID=UPI001928C1BD|nr:VCBS domain-containing protein [Mesorhizobium sp. 113-3-3]BCG82049.1 hypothetical protein MesoLj113b_55910 [Mesorhizobium sp. 113-3-3]
MATQVTGAGGTTTSFSNTPQAKDDLFTYSEDTTGVLILNVMSNDLGGNAKTLWSVDNGINTSGAMGGYVAGDLLTQDLGRTEGISPDTSLNGAKIWITADGRVGYDAATLSAAFKAQLQGLNAGQYLTDTFIYSIQLGNGTLSWATATVQFAGTNDAAVITGTISGTVIEAGGVANAIAGTPTVSGTLTDTDVDNTPNTFQAVAAGTAGDHGYGTYQMTAGGVWTFTLNNNNAAVQALNVGQNLTETFTVHTQDGTAQVVTVTIQGTNDAAVISGTSSGTVIEAGGVANAIAGTPTVSGTLTDTDVDNTPNTFQAVAAGTAGDHGYGTYQMTAGGVWTFTLNNNNAAVQALNVGQNLTETFTVHTQDGTAQVVTVTIQGTNDAAVISGTSSGTVVEAGGVGNAIAGTPTASGTLTDTDVDNTPNAFTGVGAGAATDHGYGTFEMTAGGVWTYTLDNGKAAVQALNVGGTLTDTFTVTTIDGTPQVVTVTIQGTNDAAVISGTSSGTVVEAGGVGNAIAGTPTASGTLTDTDADNTPNTFQAVAAGAASDNGYGTYQMTTGGVWTFTLNNNNATVQALNVGQHLTETFTVHTLDGTAQVVTVTIHGTNDAAVISGTTSGSVTEAGGVANAIPGTPTASSDLNDSDVDNTPDTWQTAAAGTASTGGLGTYQLDSDGQWTYTLDNSNATVQALNVGDSTTDTFTALTADGTAQVVTVTIHGTNDAAVISGTTSGSVTEAGGVANAIPGTPTASGDLNDSDVDNTPDTWQTAAAGTASTGGLGTYQLDSDGQWTYTLDNSNATVQALNVGDSTTDTFTALTADGTAQVVTVTIHGTNDAAVISGTTSGSVTEAGGVANAIPGTPTASGDLNDSDVDNTPDTWQTAAAGTASTGGLGTYQLDSDGQWTYTLDNSNATVQALNVGDSTTDTFTALTADGTAQVVTVTIHGTNDAAVISGTTSGSVTEAGGVANAIPGTPTASGDLNDSDVDNTPDTWQTAAAGTASTGGLGTYQLDSDGQWTYTLDNNNATVQALNVGDSTTDTFTALTADGTAQVVTVTIHGTNDAAVISGTTSGSVTEAGGVANAIPGTPTASGDLNDSDVDNTPDTWQTAAAGTASTGGLGTYQLDSDGQWTYTLDNNNATVQALNVGDSTTDTFTALTADGTAQVVTVTIHGTNDAAVISGTTSGSVTEAGGVANAIPGTPTASGDLNDSDVDNTPDTWQTAAAGTASTGGLGTYQLDSDGQWTYTLDNSNATVQALNVGDSTTDTFTALTADGTAQVVTVTIHGTNDAAVISGTTSGSVTEAGGVANAIPGTPTASGDLNDSDVDNTPDTWQTAAAGTASTGGLGTYQLDSDGQWTYTLDNSNATVQALNVGDGTTDTFTALTADGTAQVVTVTIHGTNDAAVISGTTSGSVTEAGGVANAIPGTPTASGDLNDSDVDNTPDTWQTAAAGTASTGGLGTYQLDSDGQWTYTLDNNNATVQALNVGDSTTDTFTALTADGTAQVVTVTIHGTNDAAVISGTTSGSVTEAGGVANAIPGTPTASGDLNDSDVDNTPDTWQTAAAGTASTGGLGTYQLDSDGQWTYTLDNSNATVQALNVGDGTTDTFTALTADGTAQVVTVTIHGTNDAAVISGTTSGSVTEAGGVANAIPGTPTASGDLNDSDVDNTPDTWQTAAAGTASTGGLGTYQLDSDGQWTYTLDNSNATVQALNVGDSTTDTFTALTADGTAQVVTVTIHGTNDAAVISGTTSGSVTEAGGVANAIPGTPTASGDLNDSDVDNTPDTWQTAAAGTASTGGLGTYQLDSDGQWTYTLDNNNATVQALNVGDSTTDTFTALTADGTAQVVTVTIHGTNDAAVISGTTSGSVTEAGGVANAIPGTPTASGDLNDSDVDNTPDTWQTAAAGTASTGGLGTYQLDSDGQWTYTLDNNNATVQALNVGDSTTDTFTALTADGTAQVVTVTIHGTNDAAVISGTTSGSVTEAGGVANAIPGTPTASGDLNDSDVDNTPDTWQTAAAGTASTGGLGTYQLDSDGQWTYTLDNSNATVQALNVGDSTTDTFTALTADGTAQVVTVTIHGTNDAAVISGTTSGSVTEAGGVANAIPGTPTASGDLNDSDVDNTPDTWQTAAAGTASTGGLGTYQLDSDGQWTYTLDNSNATVQALNVGDSTTDTFTALTADGTAQVVTVTIHGTNDAAVISGTTSGSVTEAGGVANAIPGTPTASGDLNDSDVDNTPDTWQTAAAGTASTGGLGTYQLDSDGQWTYTLDNNNATVQALNVGDSTTDTFTALTADGTAQVVTVTIHGTNDAAVISGTTSGSVTEAGGVANAIPGTPTASGDLNDSDVDNTPDTWQTAAAGTASTGGLGTYQLDSDGQWTYTLDNNNATVQALNVGDSTTDTFTALTADGTAQVVTVTIHGTNDAAVISGTTSGSVTEAGGVANAIPGTPTASGDLNDSDVDNTPDTWQTAAAGTASTGGLGTYQLDSDGQWTYTLDNSNATVQALNVGDSTTDTFTALTADGTAQVVTVTIHGTNDAAVISGTTSGSVTEAGGVANAIPGTPTASGDLNDSDVDNTPDTWQTAAAGTASTGGLGTYQLDSDGQWTYTLDNSNATVQALNVGDSTTDTFTALTADGTAQVVTVTIHGTNDAAVISGTTSGSVTEAGGVANAIPGTPTASGDLNDSDVDNTPDTWQTAAAGTASTGGLGTYQLDSDGQWTYTLDNNNATVQALNVGDSTTDTFTALTADGTAQVVTVTIHGTNDAAVISGTTSGSVTEAGGVANAIPGTPTASGDLNDSDVDNTPDTWQTAAAGTASTGGLGTYQLDSDGQWTYTLDNSNATVQALNVGDSTTDTFTALTADGTAQVVTVTIHGTNDAAVISGTTSGSVTEAGGVANAIPGTPTASGDLNDSDVDNTPDTWQTAAAGTASTGGLGTYQLDSDGQWTYTLDNNNATVQALNVGDSTTDTFTALTADGTAQVVTVTIHGTNDAAVISGTTSGSVTEAGGVANAIPGTPTASGDLNDSDVDNTPDTWQTAAAGTASTGGLGTYQLDSDGQWTYTLDNNNATVQALNVGDSTTDTFTALTADGTAQVVTVTIHGTNDAAVISGTTSGSVTEAGGVANAIPGTPTASGDLNDSDVDNTPDTWQTAAAGTASTGGLGTYQLDSDGQWTYTLDNSNATVQALNVGDSTTDTFTALTADGTAQVVTVTIHGTNDAAVISGTTSGSVTEAGGVANAIPGTPTASGDLNDSDVDNTPDTWQTAAAGTASTGGLGTYQLDSDGQWTYTLDNNNATVQALNVGDSTTDTFTALTADGTAQVVTVTIHGTNDAAVISGTTSGSVTEAGGVANAIPGTPTASGDLNDSDVDNTPDTWQTAAAGTASTGGLGTYQLDSDGQWTYTLDNSNATVQALNVGDSTTDTFTALTADGTAQVVTVTIHGTNDAAVISGTTSGSVTEAGGVANAIPGTPTASGDLNDSDVDNTPDTWQTAAAGTASTGGLGTYQLDSDGQWTYTLDNSNATVQALNVGDSTTDTFTALTADGTAQVVTVTIHGTNDAAVISGTTSGSVTEAGGVANAIPGTPTASGDLNDSDVDNTPDTWQTAAAGTASTGGLGTYQLDSDGQWTYTLDNNNATVQALNVGDSTTDTFTALTADGTAQVVTVTIHGTNDAAVISGTTSGSVTEAGGVANAIPGTPTASGDLNDSDVDNTPDTWQTAAAGTASTGGLGTYQLDSDGQWTYTLDNSNATVQALNVGDSTTDTFTALTADGTAQVVTVTIHGTNDAAVISGTTSGSVTEAGGVANAIPGTPTASGALTDTDVDNSPNTFQAVAAGAASDHGYGTYQMTTGGVWTFTLNNNNATVQALNVGQHLTDTFTVTTIDGTPQVVTVTINGTNDAAVISGVVTGTVIEAGGVGNAIPGTPTASGALTDTDVDNTPNTFQAVAAGAASDNGYGTYQMTTGGVWTFTLNNNNAAVQALNVGQHLTDTFTVTTIDGTPQVVTVTINGTNDAAVISGVVTGTVVEAGGVGNAIPGTPTASGALTDTDVDNTPNTFQAVAAGAASDNGYGTYQMTTGGIWTFTLNNNNAAVQALNVGQHLTDTFTVTTIDGTPQVVTVTINGTNDAAVISGTSTTALTETNAAQNTGGTLVATDPDSSNAFVTQTNVAGSNGYGTFSIDATGHWTYAMNTAHDEFVGGTDYTDSITVATADGTSQLITVTIHGTNDAPVVDLNGASAGLSTTLSYTTGSAATAIAPSGTIVDIDSADFNGGSLTVAFTANGTSADQLTIQNQGVGAGQIGVTGSNVTYAGTIIGTFTGGTNGSNLVVTFNANATPAAAQALADHILYSNATSATIAKTVTYTLVDGDGTANGGTDTGTATATINVTGSDVTPPSVSISHALSSSQQQSTFTVHATDASGIQSVQLYDSINGAAPVLIYTMTAAELAAGLVSGNYVHTFDDGPAPFLVSNSVHQISAVVTDSSTAHNSATAVDSVTFKTNGGGGSSTKFTAPAGTSGEPINLALTDPSHEGALITVTVKDVPSGWTIDGATHNADGSWTTQTSDLHALTVTTPASFTGAAVLDVQMTWTNADGTVGTASIADNVEAYAPGSPIFAWSGDDVLTGSHGNDLFVFSQPIGADTVHNFDAAADQIDLIGYNGLADFADLQTHIADDANGNAVITLGDGQSITLDGVHSSALTGSNFVFDQTPVVNNSGTMTIGDGALLPLSGIINNSGLISLDSTGGDTLLQVIQHGVTLQGGGQILLSDSATNIISGTGPDVTLVNVDNTISGAGQLGGGMLSLDNRGTISASGSNALVIDTGGSVAINSGTLEATGSGGLTITGGLANSGMLWANGGNIVIHGQVTGDGDATIGNLSKLEFGGASSTDVIFGHDAAGTLQLDDSFDYSGRIGGITNDDRLDLHDILFGAGTTAVYQANQDGSGGTLTVSDGTHGAALHLVGSYDATAFKLADDGQGHTVVSYNPAEFTLTGIGSGAVSSDLVM